MKGVKNTQEIDGLIHSAIIKHKKADRQERVETMEAVDKKLAIRIRENKILLRALHLTNHQAGDTLIGATALNIP